MHPENQQIHGMLNALYARTRGFVGFVDESYRESGRDGFAFYTVTATVLSASDLQRRRDQYFAVVGGNRWHTTEMNQRGMDSKILEFLTVLATHDVTTMVTVQVGMRPGTLEHARRECLIQMVSRLASAGCDLVVYERREDRKARNADEALLSRAKNDRLIPRTIRVFPGSPGAENLLWGPDLAGWAFRRLLAVGERNWVWPLHKNLEIIDVSASGALKRKGPQPAAAMGSGPDSSVGPEDEVKNRSSSSSMAHHAELMQRILTIVPAVTSPLHEPPVLSDWLHGQFPGPKY